MLRGLLDARGHALEAHREVLDATHGKVVLEEPSQREVAVQGGARARQGGDTSQDGAGEDAARGHLAPQLGQVGDTGGVGTGRDRRAVDGADGGADDDVGPHTALEQRAQHADLGGPEEAAATEDEGGPATHR